MSDNVEEREQEALMAEARVPTAGWSNCPVCGRRWLVNPYEDCMLPACGCFGDDASTGDRPCERCGLAHAYQCEKKRVTS